MSQTGPVDCLLLAARHHQQCKQPGNGINWIGQSSTSATYQRQRSSTHTSVAFIVLNYFYDVMDFLGINLNHNAVI